MDTNLDDIKHIRSMMERSSKFLSLSGMSGISAGVCALAGAGVAYLVLYGKLTLCNSLLWDFVILAAMVLVSASISGFFFCFRKARKNGAKLWMPVTLQILKDFAVPMCVGGLFCILLIYQGAMHMIAPAMLVFYGLSLITAGARTYRDIKLLGVCEIILGLLAGIFVSNSLLFWAIGFGLMHIIYGIVIYYKYDLKADKNSGQ